MKFVFLLVVSLATAGCFGSGDGYGKAEEIFGPVVEEEVSAPIDCQHGYRPENGACVSNIDITGFPDVGGEGRICLVGEELQIIYGTDSSACGPPCKDDERFQKIEGIDAFECEAI